jgi:hypothetical protein
MFLENTYIVLLNQSHREHIIAELTCALGLN